MGSRVHALWKKRIVDHGINIKQYTMEESENRVYGKDLENSGWIFGGADTFDYWNLYMDRKS